MKVRPPALLVCAWLVNGCGADTPAIRPSQDSRETAGSVAELSAIRLGGVEQFVLVRGADTTSPVLLFLHGGPGMPTMYLAHEFQRELERRFVVVQWDRRGAGKSYAARFPVESLTVRRALTDLFELTGILRKRFHRGQVGDSGWPRVRPS